MKRIETSIFRLLKGKSAYRRLEQMLETSPKKKLFFMSTYSTLTSMKQRPEHLFDEFVARGYEVVIFDRNIAKPVYTIKQYWLVPFSYFKHLALNLNIEKIIMSISTHDAIPNLEKYLLSCVENGGKVIYEHLDDFDLLKSAPKVEKRLRERFKTLCRCKKVIIVATADHLFDQAKAARDGSDENIYLVKNAVNPNDFSASGNGYVPTELKEIVCKQMPIVGYYGVIHDAWFDYELMNKVVSANKDMQFVLIGPMIGPECEKLKEHENLTYIPPVSYDKIPQYAQHFDVAVIPFQLNEITKSTSPVKMFEYMAMKKPLISTPLKECMLYKSCLIAKDSAEFSSLLKKALELKNDEDYIRLSQQEVAENTWSKRVEQIEKALAKV